MQYVMYFYVLNGAPRATNFRLSSGAKSAILNCFVAKAAAIYSLGYSKR